MKLFTTCLGLNFKKIINKLLVLLLVLTITAVLGVVVTDYASEKLGSQDLGINIAIVNQDTTMEMVVDLIIDDYLTGDNFDFALVDDIETGEELLKENQVSALVVFPEGFLESVIVGENFSPTVTLNTTDLLTKLLIESSVTSVEEYFRVLQSAVYTTFDNLEDVEITDQLILTVNLNLAQYVLDTEDLYKTQTLPYTDSLSVTDFYLISFVVYVLFLTTCLFHEEFNFQKNILTVKFISTYNKGFYQYYLSKILLVFAVYCAVFLGLAVYLGGLDFLTLVSAINLSLLFTLFQVLVFNVLQSFMATVQINFVMHTVFLFLSGGIIPTLMLPQLLVTLGKLTPIYWIRNLLACGIVDDNIIVQNIFVLIFNLFLILGLYILCRKQVTGKSV